MPEYHLGLQHLAHIGPLSAVELATLLGITKRSATEYVRLWRAEGKVRIVDWQRRTLEESGAPGDFVPLYGPPDHPGQPDAARPRRFSQGVKQKRYRERHRAVIQVRKRAGRGTTSMFAQLLL